VGLKNDGTVVAVGDNDYGQCSVDGWLDIDKVAAGGYHTVGLKNDGTVVAVGDNGYGQCSVGNWTDVNEVAAGGYHTLGLKSDDTLLAAGPEVELAGWNLGVIKHALTISSTAGGSITTPGQGAFTYNAGGLVRIIAEPEKGYRFISWTGDVNAIANVNAATTVVTMDNDYSVTASFEKIPPINWPLVGGIIAAVIVVGLVIYFLRKKRLARTKGPRKKRPARTKKR
jgi:hypothetical protein